MVVAEQDCELVIDQLAQARGRKRRFSLGLIEGGRQRFNDALNGGGRSRLRHAPGHGLVDDAIGGDPVDTPYVIDMHRQPVVAVEARRKKIVGRRQSKAPGHVMEQGEILAVSVAVTQRDIERGGACQRIERSRIVDAQHLGDASQGRAPILLVLVIRRDAQRLAEVLLVDALNGPVLLDDSVVARDHEQELTGHRRCGYLCHGQTQLSGRAHAECLVLDGVREPLHLRFEDVGGGCPVHGAAPGPIPEAGEQQLLLHSRQRDPHARVHAEWR